MVKGMIGEAVAGVGAARAAVNYSDGQSCVKGSDQGEFGRRCLKGVGILYKRLTVGEMPCTRYLIAISGYERRGEGGERVLVLGDSFTQKFWLPLLQHSDAERIGWMHHSGCGFDFADVERFEPTLVILAPTERGMPCSLKAWPHGLQRG